MLHSLDRILRRELAVLNAREYRDAYREGVTEGTFEQHPGLQNAAKVAASILQIT